jgi:hypothetical protein
MICFDCRKKIKGSARNKMLPVYQLDNITSNPFRQLWRSWWCLFVCRSCYRRHYQPWKVEAGT